MTCLVGGGALGGVLLLTWAGHTSKSEDYVDSPEFLVEALLVVGQTALWALSLAIFVGAVRALQEDFWSLVWPSPGLLLLLLRPAGVSKSDSPPVYSAATSCSACSFSSAR